MRYVSLGSLLFVSALVGLLACGEASLKVSTPTPTPSDEVDCTFATGVMEVLATRDCGNAGCHLDPGQASLTLVSGNLSSQALYGALMDPGGASQQASNCGGVLYEGRAAVRVAQNFL